MNKQNSRVVLGFSVMLPLLAACTVGPDYAPPAAPPVERYTMQAMSDKLAAGRQGVSQNFAVGQATPTDWWQSFQSAELNGLVRQALSGNFTITAAQARLGAAQATVKQVTGGLYPQLDASGSTARRKSGNSSANDVYALGANVGFDPDIFGGQKRRIEQEEANRSGQEQELAAARLSVAGNVVDTAITLAALRQQIKIVKEIIADDGKTLELVRQKLRAGKAAQTDVLAAESQLANDKTQLAPLKQQKNMAQHALAVLLGQFPGQWKAPKLELDALKLPETLGLALPSALAHKRPDIMAAEADLQAANAAIGVATAQMYPDLNLSGSLAVQALSTAVLFDGASLIWTLAADLAVPIFHGGALEAQEETAQANYRAVLATYQQTVLTAFGQVADTLRALKHDAQQEEATRVAYETARSALALQKLSYAAGKTDLLQLLDAQRGAQQATLSFVRIQAQRLQDTAALSVAMGGGLNQTPAP